MDRGYTGGHQFQSGPGGQGQMEHMYHGIKGMAEGQTMINLPDMTRPPPPLPGLLPNVPQQHQQQQYQSRPQRPQKHEQGEPGMHFVGGDMQLCMRRELTGNPGTREYRTNDDGLCTGFSEQQATWRAMGPPHLQQRGGSGFYESEHEAPATMGFERDAHQMMTGKGKCQPYQRGHSHAQQCGPTDSQGKVRGRGRLKGNIPLPTGGKGGLGKRSVGGDLRSSDIKRPRQTHWENQKCPNGRDQKKPNRRDSFHQKGNRAHNDNVGSYKPRHRKNSDCDTMAATGGFEGYVRLSLLTHRGGIWISKKIFLREVAKTHGSPSPNVYLKENDNKLKEMIKDGHMKEKQYKHHFKRVWAKPIIDELDVALLIKIVQKLFGEILTKKESSELYQILNFRNDNICHVNAEQMRISERKFNDLWEGLKRTIRSLASSFDEVTRNEFSKMEKSLKTGSLDLQSSVDNLVQIYRNEEHMKSVTDALTTMADDHKQDHKEMAEEIVSAISKVCDAKQDTTNAKLEEFFAKFYLLMERNGIIDVEKPMEIPTMKCNWRIKGKDGKVDELSTVELLEVIRHCIKEHIHPNDDESLIQAVTHVLNDIKKAGAVPVSVEKGSIILNIKCPTLPSLENILSLFRMVHNRWRLHELEKALSEKFQASMEVDLVLTENTIEMLSIWIDGCLNDTSNLLGDMPCKRTLSMGIQCHSAEAVTKVVKYFHSDESTNRLNQLSKALSDVVQDEVMVDVQLDTEGFLEAFKTSYETEIIKQEHSRRNAEARTSDIESSPENVQNETEPMKQEQSRRDAEARTSDIECNPENVQTKSMLDGFEDELYINWLKRSLALIYTKKALESFTDREVCVLHNQLRPPGSSSGAPPTCGACSKTQLKNQWFKGTFKCYGNVCDKWVQGILQHHVFPRQVEWDNVDISQLPLVPWECMKLYLPFGYQRQSNVQEFDLAALLTLYLNCRHFHTFFNSMIICKQVKEVSNRVMHSGQMKVDTTQLLADVATIKALLQDPQHLINDPDCQEGVRKIDKLMAERLELSSNMELELRVLNSTMRELEDKVVQMQNKYEDISSKLHTMSGDVEALKEETSGNKAQWEELQKVKQDIIELKNSVDVFTSFKTAQRIQGVDTTSLLQCESKLTSLSQSVEQTLKQHEQKLLEHDQKLHQQGQKVQEHDQTLHQQKQMVQEHDQTLHQQGQKVQEHDQTLHQHGQTVQTHDQTIQQQGQTVQEHDQTLHQQWQKVQEHDQTFQEQGQTFQEHVHQHEQRLEGLKKREKPAKTSSIECSP